MPDRGLTRRDLYSAILFAALIYLAITFITQIVDVILIFSVTLLVVTILNPTVSRLERRRIPRQVSAGVLAVATIGLFSLLLYLVIPPAVNQLQDLTNQAPAAIRTVQDSVRGLAAKYPTLEKAIPKGISVDPATIREFGRSAIGGASTVTASAVGAVAGAFLVFILTIYTLINPRPLGEGILRTARPDLRSTLVAAGERLGVQIRAWGTGVLTGMFAIFLLTWIALSIIGIKQAFLFAVIAGLLEAVPVIGPVLSAIPPTIVALLHNPVMAIWVILAFIIIQQLESNVLVPMIMSRQLSLHPVTVVFSVLVMGGLFGIIGIFLAVPAAATVGVLYDELYLCRREDKCEHQIGTLPWEEQKGEDSEDESGS